MAMIGYNRLVCALLLCGAVLPFVISMPSAHGEKKSNGRNAMPVVRIRGVEQSDLRNALEALSPLLWQGAQPPASEIILRSRARRHQERLQQALASEGHYAGSVEFDVRWDAPRPEAIFEVAAGAPYRIDVIEVAYHHAPGSGVISPPPVYVSPGLQQNAIARTRTILDGEKQVRDEAANAGFPFAQVYDRRVIVNHATQSVKVGYFLALGDQLVFGEARLEGFEKVRPETALRELPWQEGETYRAALLGEAQDTLQKTGLFSVVRVAPAPPEEAQDGAIPIVISVTERLHRSVALGLQYRTDEGIGVGGHWEHRNFAGLGRRLRIQSNITELEQSLSVDYGIEQFRRPDQTLTLQAKAAQLDPDPYRSRRFDLGAYVERKISPEWTVGAGPALRISRVEERNRQQQYYLASFPMQIAYDRRDDLLDPNRGYRLANRMTPFVDVTSIDTYFVKNEFSVSHYLQFSGLPRLTLATRFRLGVLGGAGLSEIPADERFYAGGGGSIRGYAYQKVGPLDEEGNPTGGRSLTDWSVELRHRLSDTLGIVAFVDGGMAHKNVYPDFGDALQWGAGVGARYFTPIGPLRLDVATPLNRRRGIDGSVQFYISIGQAF